MRGDLAFLEALPRGGHAAALLTDGRLEDLLIDPAPDDPLPRPGALYRALLGRPMKGLGGAIVDLGGQSGFLRETRGLAPGALVLVQVATSAEPGKAPPVTTRVLLKRRHAIVTPGAPGRNLARALPEADRPRLAALAASAMAGAPEDLGLILRSACAEAEEAAIVADIAALRADWSRAAAPGRRPTLLLPAPGAAETARAEWPIPPVERPGAFAEHGLWESAEALLSPLVPLPAGAALAIEPTRALVAVDVNTGPDLSPAAGLKAALAAVRDLPRQLRLRGLGGQIVIDFAALPKRERPRIETTLKAALARDGIETTIAGWTPLGHLELNRKRARRPLAELMPR